MKFIEGARTPLSEEQFAGADIARFYDEHSRRFMLPIFRWFVRKVTKIDPAGKDALDIGTGSGLLAIELAKSRLDWRITGVDISEAMLKIACESAARNGLSGRADFRQAPAERLPFADDSFTLVTSNASLHLWTDPHRVFGEIARVTSPGGYCLIWDNLRLSNLSPLLSLAGMVMGMSAPQRRLWIRAIRSSYTTGEAKAMLDKSALRGARVKITPGFLGFSITWRKPS